MNLNGRFYFSFQQKPSTFDGSVLTGILTIQIRHLSSAAGPARLCSAGVLRTQLCRAPPAPISDFPSYINPAKCIEINDRVGMISPFSLWSLSASIFSC